MVYYSAKFYSILLCVIYIIVGCKCASVSDADVVTDNSTSPEDPHEIQKAVCTVTAGEVRASAEAITTKTLHGVCGSAEMNLALHNLESKLYKELQEIKLLLSDIRSKNLHDIPIKTKPLISNQEFVHTTKTPIPTPQLQTTVPSILEETTITLKPKSKPNLKSLTTKNNPFKEKSFSYFWKLENFTEHINGSSGRVESPVFSIKGKPLRIKASFNHLRRDFLYLHLVYAVFENRDKFMNNIVLDTGGIFKHIDEKVLFNYRISILDQNNGSNDLESQEFSTLDSGFPIPMSTLISPTYSKNNSLLIQISLYL